jgi:tRNA (guanine37-N1)-methyltransferase
MGENEEEMNIFRPPLVRASTTLNRALFAKTVDVAAARVGNPQNIGRYRKALEAGREILQLERISPVISDPDESLASQGRKCLLLKPGIKAEGNVNETF